MSPKTLQIPTFNGRSLSILILTGLQLLIGAIHLFSGLLLLAYEPFAALPATAAYDIYTFVFGLLVVVFAFGIWRGREWGWAGTILVSVFVVIADSSTLLDLPLVPGTPKGPALAEIVYSVILVAYLLRGKVRKNFV